MIDRGSEAYRLGYLAGHGDAIDALGHLFDRGVPFASIVERLKRFHWNRIRPWVERDGDVDRFPDFCVHDKHGPHMKDRAPEAKSA